MRYYVEKTIGKRTFSITGPFESLDDCDDFITRAQKEEKKISSLGRELGYELANNTQYHILPEDQIES